jgi:predicted nucleic acid-binding protein
MILIDTSVWVDHLRNGNKKLIELLNDEQVACHPFIIGELACGNLKNRAEILELLQTLPKVLEAENEDVFCLIENHKLMGKGLGFIDMHLLASAILSDVNIWTMNKTLCKTADSLGLGC